MDASVEAAGLLGIIAGDRGSKKERQRRAWRTLIARFPASKWTANRVHDLFTEDRRAVVRADEIAQLREAAKFSDSIPPMKAEFYDLIARVEQLEHAVAVADKEFSGSPPAENGKAMRFAR
jgi:hypothetical protein